RAAVSARVNQFAFPAIVTVQVLFDLIQRFWKTRLEKLVSNAAPRCIRSPSVEFFCDAVPTSDAVVTVAHNDGVEPGIEHARPFRQHFPLFLGPPAFGDIAEDEDRPEHRSIRTADRRSAVVDRYFGSVPGDKHRVVGQTDNMALTDCT